MIEPPVRTQARVARALAALPPRVQATLSGRPPITIDGQRLEPEVQLLLSLRRVIGEPVWDERLSPARARALAREEAGMAAGTRPIPVGAVRELEVAGQRARHYAPPEDTGPRPLLLFWHGGGFVVGDLDTHDAPCRMLCRHAGVHVLSVEYRLAPEHPFPAWLDDAHAAYAWAREHAAELGADGRLVVGGDSAGGNIAAVIAQETRGRGGVGGPDLQLLIYPAVDASRRRRSYELFGKDFFLTDTLMEWYSGHFLGAGADPTDPRRSPLLAADLSGAAPALVVTAGFDPLRDEGEAYAAALAAAGVPVLTRRFTGLFHTFINCVGISPASRAAMAEVGGMLRALLAMP
jgi:acetyl esterase